MNERRKKSHIVVRARLWTIRDLKTIETKRIAKRVVVVDLFRNGEEQRRNKSEPAL